MTGKIEQDNSQFKRKNRSFGFVSSKAMLILKYIAFRITINAVLRERKLKSSGLMCTNLKTVHE